MLTISHTSKLAGFNGCREGDDMSVHGFKFARGRNSVVETYWKSSAGLDKGWRGMDGREDSPAFEVLRSIPQGTPEVVAPANAITTQEYFRQFIGEKMTSAMVSEQFTPDVIGALRRTFARGTTPMEDAPIDSAVRMGKLGKRYVVGSSIATVTMCVVKPLKPEEMFAVPEAAKESGHRANFGIGNDAASQTVDSQRLPVIGYQDTPTSRRAMHMHPNNIAFRQRRAEVDESTISSDLQEMMDELPSGSSKERRERKRGLRKKQVPAAANDEDSDGKSCDSEYLLTPPKTRQRTEEVQSHDVHVVFGGTLDNPETWLFVKGGRSHIQWLERQLDNRFVVTKINKKDKPFDYWKPQIVESFKLEFTTTRGRTTTKKPFDEDKWQELEERCIKWADSDDSD